MTIVESKNHWYEGIVKQNLFFHVMLLRVIRCTRMHKFHFSSDARERNGVVFRIINSGVYRRLDTASQKNCKRETWTFVERVIIMRLMETLRASVKKRYWPTILRFFYLPFSMACLATAYFVINAVVRCSVERKSDRVWW